MFISEHVHAYLCVFFIVCTYIGPDYVQYFTIFNTTQNLFEKKKKTGTSINFS